MKKIKCDTSKCHAACCYNVPMEKGYITAFKKRIVTPVKSLGMCGDEDRKTYERRDMGEFGRAHYVMITDDDPAKNKCPFLRDDCKCNIYESRPKICRMYGQTPNVRFLHCKFLNGDEGMPTQQETVEAIMETAKMFLHKP